MYLIGYYIMILYIIKTKFSKINWFVKNQIFCFNATIEGMLNAFQSRPDSMFLEKRHSNPRVCKVFGRCCQDRGGHQTRMRFVT